MLGELGENLFAVADGLGAPVEFEVENFLVGELPVDVVAGAEARGEGEEGEGGGDGDVEGFGESEHGYFDVGVGEVDGLGGESGEFGAEDEDGGGGDVEVVDEGVVVVGGGGDDAIAEGA